MRPGKVLLLTSTPHVAVEGADEGEMKMDVEKCQLGNLWKLQRVEMSFSPVGWIPGVNKDALCFLWFALYYLAIAYASLVNIVMCLGPECPVHF